jgi:hypothetical protein
VVSEISLIISKGISGICKLRPAFYLILAIQFYRISNLRQQWEFWRAALKHIPEPGIDDLLKYLSRKRIKTGVVSNTMFSGKILERELKKQRIIMAGRENGRFRRL